MISNDEELRVTLSRIGRFQQQVIRLRQVETNPTNYRLSAEGYLAEIDRMNLEVRDYFSLLPSEVTQDEAAPVSTQFPDSALP
ncbi:MAG: hypothetical protein AABO57_17100 [Acidobacteriota bacterium]